MSCACCNLRNLSLDVIAYKCFLCANGHIQCNECNDGHNEQCGVCGNMNECILIIPQPYPRRTVVSHSKIIPPAEGHRYFANTHNASRLPCCVSPPPLLNEIAKLSAVLQEYLKNNYNYSRSEDKQSDNPSSTLRAFKFSGEKSMSTDRQSMITISERSTICTSTCATKFDRPVLQNTRLSGGSKNVGKRNAPTKPRPRFRPSQAMLGQTEDFLLESTINYYWTNEPLVAFNVRRFICKECKRDVNIRPTPLRKRTVDLPTDSGHSLRSVPVATNAHSVNLQRKFANQNYVVMHAAGVAGMAGLTGMAGDGSMAGAAGMTGVANTAGIASMAGAAGMTSVATKAGMKGVAGEVRVADVAYQLPKIVKNTNDQDVSKPKATANKITTAPENSPPRQQQTPKTVHMLLKINTNRSTRQEKESYKAHKPLSRLLATSNVGSKEQTLQFKHIYTSSMVLQVRMSSAPDSQKTSVLEAYRLKPPTPFKCPDSRCCSMLCISDFEWHFDLDHNTLPKDCITLHQRTQFLLGKEIEYEGKNKCHHIYYLMDNITDRNIRPYKYFLPLVVMSSRVSLPKSASCKSLTEYILVWVTGIISQERPIHVTFTVLPCTGIHLSRHLIYSGQVYNILKSQNVQDVYDSGHMLLLSLRDVSILTKKFKVGINMQLIAEIRVSNRSNVPKLVF